MKTFVVYFKSGAKVAVKADALSVTKEQITFTDAEGNKTEDVFVAANEVLYVVAADSLAEMPIDVK